jgi:hypothetical protein
LSDDDEGDTEAGELHADEHAELDAEAAKEETDTDAHVEGHEGEKRASVLLCLPGIEARR